MVTFEIFDPEIVFGPILSPPQYSDEYIEEHKQFDNSTSAGYEKIHTVSNLGFTFMILVMILIVSASLCIMAPLKRTNVWVQTRFHKVQEALYWNTYLRYLIEGALEICISTTINI